MATKKAGNILMYFTKTDDPNRVRCKLCKKYLGGRRTFNLKAHLKTMHKLEIRVSKRRGGLQHNDTDRKPGWIDENAKDSSTTMIFENMTSPGLNIKNEVLLDPDNLLEIRDKFEKGNESETRIPSNVDEEEIDLNPNSARELTHATHDDVSTLTLPNQVSTNDEEIIDPLSKSTENGWVMLEESTFTPSIIDFETVPKTKNRSIMPKSITITAENLDETTSRLKEDSFEQMFKKKKLSLELERLEMHNYKIKLEIWEIEQKLQLQSSKFTKNIVARRKKTENNDE